MTITEGREGSSRASAASTSGESARSAVRSSRIQMPRPMSGAGSSRATFFDHARVYPPTPPASLSKLADSDPAFA